MEAQTGSTFTLYYTSNFFTPLLTEICFSAKRSLTMLLFMSEEVSRLHCNLWYTLIFLRCCRTRRGWLRSLSSREIHAPGSTVRRERRCGRHPERL